MAGLVEQTVSCPYCGESISILLDDSVQEQHYVEDCEVCCRPIEIDIAFGPDGEAYVGVRTDTE